MLVSEHKKLTDEVVRTTMERLVNPSMTPGQDPDDFFMEKALARSKKGVDGRTHIRAQVPLTRFELGKMDRPTCDRTVKESCVQAFTTENKGMKPMVCWSLIVNMEQTHSTASPVP